MRFVPLVTTLVYAAAGVAAGQHEGAQVISCTHKPLTTPAVAPVEVFVFDPPTNETDWSQMDWEQITTLALFGPWPPPEDLYCHAHAHNVKIVKCVDFDAAGIANATARQQWVEGIVSEAVSLGTDGANVDIEGFRGQKEDLNQLIQELSTKMKAAIPTAQVTFDTDVYPSQEPSYDYATLAKWLDFFVPMAYDMIGPPTQLANCPYNGLNQSMVGYHSYGVKPQQIVYGLPWYGYDYPCSDFTPGTPCTPQCPGGRKTCPQVDYKQAIACRLDGAASASYCQRESGTDDDAAPVWQYDTTSATVFFEYTNSSGVRHQTWYDDEVSLGVKYRQCRALGVRGMAMWQANSLEYGSTPKAMARTARMWETLRELTQKD